METPRQKYLRHLTDLKAERSTWLRQWEELADYISPRRYRYLQTDRNKGTRKDSNIINSRPTKALGVLQAGMMSGITPESRPWFRFTTSDPALTNSADVRAWLDLCEEIVRETLSKSNFYTSLFQVYGDLGLFGTSPMHVDEDEEDVIRCYVWPAGQYCLSNSARLQVTSSYRELQLTVEQMVEKFGLEKCSRRVQDAHKQSKLSELIAVIHVVEPNRDHEPGRPGWRFMRFKSCWFEAAGDGAADTAMLSEGGYNENPVMSPRWDVTGEDVYGSSPAMVAIGDIKALQFLERMKAQAVEKIVNPPMKGPMSLQNRKASILPGRFTYVPETGAGQTFSPAMEVNPAAVEVSEATVREHTVRIDSDFYADLWLMMANSDDPRMTATEVAERKAEKMLQLGPVMDRVTGELLSPAIERIFEILQRRGRLPKPPREIQGKTVRIQYISIVAQAQKMMSIGAIDKLAAFISSIAQGGRQDVLDKLNVDNAVDEYGDDLGVPSKLIVPTEQAQKARAARAQQMAKQQQMEQLQAATKSAQQLSGASLEGDNALSRIVGSLPESAQGGGLEQG